MAKARELVLDTEQQQFSQILLDQASASSVPLDSQRVPGSIYQTNLDVTLANQTLPGE